MVFFMSNYQREIFRWFSLLAVVFLTIDCKVNDKSMPQEKSVNADTANQKPKCSWDGDFVFDCKYKFIVMGPEDKGIKVPVYGGEEGEIRRKDIRKALNMGDIAFGFAYKYQPGQGKKLLLDILGFYKSSLLKDIDIYRPTVIGGEPGLWIIWYDFDVNGVPGTIKILAPMVALKGSENIDKKYMEKDGDLRDIRGINVGEYKRAKNSRVLTFDINFGERSGFQKK